MTARFHFGNGDASATLLTLGGGDVMDKDIAIAIAEFERRCKAKMGIKPGEGLRADEAADGRADRYDPALGYGVAAEMWKEQGLQPVANPFDGKPTLRADSAGAFFARELEQIDPVVLRDKYKKLNSMVPGNFNVTLGAVRPGARTLTLRRLSQHGKAKIIRNDDTQIPNVAISRKEQSFKVIYGAIGQSWNIWDEQSADFASVDLASEFGMVSERALGQFLNDINFNGDIPSNVFGILTNPEMARFHTSTPFTSASTADDILAALNRGANYASVYSGDTFSSDTLGICPRAHAYLSSRMFGSGAPGKSILQVFLENHPTVKNVKVMHELQDTTTARKDKFLFYQNDKLAMDLLIGQPYVLIPGVPGQMRRTAVAFCSCLGNVQRESGNNCLMTAVLPA